MPCLLNTITICSIFIDEHDFIFFVLQGGYPKSSHDEFNSRHGLSSNLSDAGIQQKLDEMRENLKKEIRKEMKIKEGAERLREVTTDKKSLSNINSIVKKSNTKLIDLHEELKELNAYLISKNETGTGELSVFVIPITPSISCLLGCIG